MNEKMLIEVDDIDPEHAQQVPGEPRRMDCERMDGIKAEEDINDIFKNLMGKAKKGMTSDVALVKKIKTTLIILTMKIRSEREELEQRLKDQIDLNIRSKVDTALLEMAQVREAIDFDMKRWKTQRADLQIELGHLMQKVDFKPDEGLNILNSEAVQFDKTFSGGPHNIDIDMTALTNADTGMHGPPSFLTMLEKQSR